LLRSGRRSPCKRGDPDGKTASHLFVAPHRAVLRQLIIDLDHVDATIRIFAPKYNV
jgi:hypothetical protein